MRAKTPQTLNMKAIHNQTASAEHPGVTCSKAYFPEQPVKKRTPTRYLKPETYEQRIENFVEDISPVFVSHLIRVRNTLRQAIPGPEPLKLLNCKPRRGRRRK